MAKSHIKSSEEHDDGIDKIDGIKSPAGLDDEYDLIIIGAGPSGLFCAINSGQKERKILILEKKDSPGRKLLISGLGHCNITNEKDIHSFLDHYGDNSRFLRPALFGFTNRDLISFFEKKGLEMIREKGGKIFPATLRSRDVLNILLDECRTHEVQVKCGQEVSSIERNGDGFKVFCGNNCYRSRLLVIATGGCSYPGTGSTGDGYRFASDLGHRIVDVGPALAPVLIKDYPFFDLAGLSFEDMKNLALSPKEDKRPSGRYSIHSSGALGTRNPGSIQGYPSRRHSQALLYAERKARSSGGMAAGKDSIGWKNSLKICSGRYASLGASFSQVDKENFGDLGD